MHDETSTGVLAVARVTCPAGVGVGGQWKTSRAVCRRGSGQVVSAFPVPVRRFIHCAATFFRCELQIITIRRQEIRTGAYRVLVV